MSELRDKARAMAKASIVTDATARLIEQVLIEAADYHSRHIDELQAALRLCQTVTPSLMDGEAAKERLKEINRHVYAVFGQ